MNNTDSLKLGFGVGFIIGIVFGLMFAASDMRAAEVISEYKAGKIACADPWPHTPIRCDRL